MSPRLMHETTESLRCPSNGTRAAPSLRVAVAEDSLVVRTGLVELLAACDDVEVIAAVESSDGLLAAIAAEPPDVVLTDIQMGPGPSDDGIAAARLLRRTNPDLGVVVLSAYVEPAYAVDLLDAGTRGRGYLVKDHLANLDYLLDALRTVASGGSFLDDAVVDALVRSRSRVKDSGLADLTAREREVLAEMAAGRSNAAIATELSISKHAVEKHTNTILSKLGLSNDPDINRRVAAVLVYLTGNDDAPRGRCCPGTGGMCVDRDG